jgi:hypothetical protein
MFAGVALNPDNAQLNSDLLSVLACCVIGCGLFFILDANSKLFSPLSMHIAQVPLLGRPPYNFRLHVFT